MNARTAPSQATPIVTSIVMVRGADSSKHLSRRTILKLGALLGGSSLLTGCEGVISETTRRFGLTIPERIILPNGVDIDPVFHLLSRAAYGPWPGDIELVRKQGVDRWIDEQLNPQQIDDTLGELRCRRFETIYMRPGDCYEFKNEALRDDITRYTLLKALYSKRQLYEVMVAFWTDHLNINLEKGDCIYLKTSDDRDVVRAHALGNFKDMIKSSCLSPAMLVYLDGKENKRAHKSDVPNENYARELMELHTLGVDGGYTQQDVFEAARCLTGWRIRQRGEFQKGSVYFDSSLHDNGEKVVLGKTITAGGGARDVDELIDIVVNHPSTAKHVCAKLVRYFVADDPQEALEQRLARQFSAGKGEIKPLVKTILTSKEFNENKGNKFKRPFRFVVSALRGLGADTFAKSGLTEYLSRMGHSPFQHPTPDGYPEEMLPWLGSLLWRWNFALALASNQLESVDISLRTLAGSISGETEKLGADQLVRHLVGRKPTAAELEVLEQFEYENAFSKKRAAVRENDKLEGTNYSELLGLILSSPAFQRF